MDAFIVACGIGAGLSWVSFMWSLLIDRERDKMFTAKWPNLSAFGMLVFSLPIIIVKGILGG